MNTRTRAAVPLLAAMIVCLAAAVFSETPPPDPFAMGGEAPVFANAKLYIQGGYNGSAPVDALGKTYNQFSGGYGRPGHSIYDPATNTWANAKWDGTGPQGVDNDGDGIAEIGEGLHTGSQQSFAFDDDGDGTKELFKWAGYLWKSQLWRYDPDTDAWSVKAQDPTISRFANVRGGVAVVYRDEMYAFSGDRGGSGGGNPYYYFTKINLVTGTVTQLPNAPAWAFAEMGGVLKDPTSGNDKMVLLGGSWTGWNPNIARMYDFTTGTWSAQFANPMAGWGYGATFGYGGKLYAMPTGGPAGFTGGEIFEVVIDSVTGLPVATQLTATRPVGTLGTIDDAAGTVYVGNDYVGGPDYYSRKWWKASITDILAGTPNWVPLPDDPSPFPYEDWASGDGTVQGYVKDSSMNGIVGATVRIGTAPSTKETTTDGAGFYTIKYAPGMQPISASATGYVTVDEAVEVIANSTVDKDFVLQGLPKVTGVVRDGSGNPIWAATVQLDPAASGPSMTTSADGVYLLSHTTAGTYDIKASAQGFASVTDSVTLVADTTVVHDFTLAAAAAVQPPDPFAMGGEQPVFANGKLYIAGGYNGSAPVDAAGRTYNVNSGYKRPGLSIYNPTTDTWTDAKWDRTGPQGVDNDGNGITEIDEGLHTGYAQTFASDDDSDGVKEIFKFAGYRWQGQLWRYDPNDGSRGKWSVKAQDARFADMRGGVAVLYGSEMYAFSGDTTPASGNPRPYFTKIDLLTGTVTELPNAPDWAFAEMGGILKSPLTGDDMLVLIAGAWTNWNQYGTVFIARMYDLTTGTWTDQFPNPLPGRLAGAAGYGTLIPYGGKLYAFATAGPCSDPNIGDLVGNEILEIALDPLTGLPTVTKLASTEPVNGALAALDEATGTVYIGNEHVGAPDYYSRKWWKASIADIIAGTQNWVALPDDPSPFPYEDWASVIEVGSIGSTKSKADGTFAILSGKRLTALPGAGGIPVNTAYIEEPDRSSAIRVDTSAVSGSLPSVYTGLVRVTGTLASLPSGEKYIVANSLQYVDDGIAISPLGMNNRFAQTSLSAGLLVKIWGVWGDWTGTSYTIRDGAGTPITVEYGALPLPGELFATLVGILSTDGTNTILYQRE